MPPTTYVYSCKLCCKTFKKFKYLKDHIYSQKCLEETPWRLDANSVSYFSEKLALKDSFRENDKNLDHRTIIPYNFPGNPVVTTENKQKTTRNSQKMLNIVLKENCCEFCTRAYLHKSSLSRHRATCLGLKLAKMEEDSGEQTKTTTPATQPTQIMFSGTNQLNVGSNVQNIANQTHTINSHNTMNNINTLNTTTNTTTNKVDIKINPFGCEDISNMSEAEKLEILKSGAFAFKNLLKYTYSLPENQNVFLLNKRDKTVQFLNSLLQIETGDMDEILADMVLNNINRLDEMYDDVGDKLDRVAKRTFERIAAKYQAGDKDDAYKRIGFMYLIDASAINKKHIHNFLTIKGKDGKDKVLIGPIQTALEH